MRARETQRGSVLATTAVVLAGLIGVAGLSVLSVQRGLGVSGQQRGHSQALHAAEAGIAASASFLRQHIVVDSHWGPYVVASCSSTSCPSGTPVSPPEIVGNGALPGTTDNPFAPEAEAWFDITLFNNANDPSFSLGADQDKIIVIRSTGHGPDGARVVLEVEVEGTPAGATADSLCVGYAQQGMSELNSGRNDCFQGGAANGRVDDSSTATYSPGGT